MPKTMIIFTMGPSVMNVENLKQIMRYGADYVRFNFSHASYEWIEEALALVHQAESDVKRKMKLIGDTRGPEVRLGNFSNGKVIVQSGDEFVLTTKKVVGNQNVVSITYPDLPLIIRPGNTILLADGIAELQVVYVEAEKIVTKVIHGGELSDGKRVACPGLDLELPFMSEKDEHDILFAARHDFDYVAASFVQRASDVKKIRSLLDKNGYKKMKIIAKLENLSGIKKVDNIIDVADGIMVARGDLGLEISLECLPLIQKRIIRKCNEHNKMAITATQMLESMCNNFRPTRAEVSDVANSIFDGTDVVMLSGETASGKYPVESVLMMEKIIETTERSEEYRYVYMNKYF